MTTTTVDFYVVQRCWFDGPHVSPPVDYLRLLSEPQAAQVALASAHAYGKAHQSVVRTIVLPSNTAYAYVTAHVLFWVRRVQATMPAVAQGRTLTNTAHPIHAILTNGVIGGNGGRRGTEVSAGRIYGGPASAQWALQQCESLGPNHWITCLPTGLPENHNILCGWPDHQEYVMGMEDDSDIMACKRSLLSSSNDDGGWVMDRPAKRLCPVQRCTNNMVTWGQ